MRDYCTFIDNQWETGSGRQQGGGAVRKGKEVFGYLIGW